MRFIEAIPRSASRIRQAISPIVSVEICDYANTSALRRPLRPTAPDYSALYNVRRPNRGVMPGGSTAIAWGVMFVPPDRPSADTDSVVLSVTLAQSEHITRVRQNLPPVSSEVWNVLLGPARIMTYWVPWAACPPLHPGSGRQAAAGTPIIGKAGLNRHSLSRRLGGSDGRRTENCTLGHAMHERYNLFCQHGVG